jgi:replicative DNA helicase
MAEIDSIRRMPYSIEAEQAILGTIIIDPQKYDEVSHLSAEEFYLEQHKQIFAAMTKMFLGSKDIDLVTLIDTMTQMGTYSEGDAAKYIKLLADIAAKASNITEYAKIVRDKAMLRSLIDASNDISDRAYSELGNVTDVLQMAEQRIYEISDQTFTKNFDHVRDAILKNYDISKEEAEKDLKDFLLQLDENGLVN